MRYRKKPVVVEAEQLTGGSQATVAMWCHGIPQPDGTIVISTLEGAMTAEVGDYIIRGVKGEFYPCKPDIFAATYEPVETPMVVDPRDVPVLREKGAADITVADGTRGMERGR